MDISRIVISLTFFEIQVCSHINSRQINHSRQLIQLVFDAFDGYYQLCGTCL